MKILLAMLAGIAAFLFMKGNSMPPNVRAFLKLIREIETNDDYFIINGGEHFDDTSDHPFVIDPHRPKSGTSTASGAYQMVKRTWLMAKDYLGLTDFSPASQDAAAIFLLKHKVPGQNIIKPEGTGIYELIESGQFDAAMQALTTEWEAFAKILQGRYHVTLDEARNILVGNGGNYA